MSKSQKKYKPKINTVCNILVKDADGNYRKAFSVEGDKETDHSIYFLVWNDTTRDTVTKYSYHAKQTQGLVQTHIGKDGLREVSKKFQKSLVIRKRAIFSICGMLDINRLAVVEKQESDIVVSIQTRYLDHCIYLFYTTQQGLYEYAKQHNEVLLHNYKVPSQFIPELKFAVLIQEDVLRTIQGKNQKHHS